MAFLFSYSGLLPLSVFRFIHYKARKDPKKYIVGAKRSQLTSQLRTVWKRTQPVLA